MTCCTSIIIMIAVCTVDQNSATLMLRRRLSLCVSVLLMTCTLLYCSHVAEAQGTVRISVDAVCCLSYIPSTDSC